MRILRVRIEQFFVKDIQKIKMKNWSLFVQTYPLNKFRESKNIYKYKDIVAVLQRSSV